MRGTWATIVWHIYTSPYSIFIEMECHYRSIDIIKIIIFDTVSFLICSLNPHPPFISFCPTNGIVRRFHWKKKKRQRIETISVTVSNPACKCCLWRRHESPNTRAIPWTYYVWNVCKKKSDWWDTNASKVLLSSWPRARIRTAYQFYSWSKVKRMNAFC